MDKLLRLEEILDIYGATPERWPEDKRDELLSLVQSDEAAGKMLREAKALDALLETPLPANEMGTEALFQSIMGQVDDREVATADVIDLQPHLEVSKRNLKKEIVSGDVPGDISEDVSEFVSGPRPFMQRYRWEMGAMAASLMIGLFLGLSDVSPMLMGSEFEIATVSNEVSDFLLSDDGLQDIF